MEIKVSILSFLVILFSSYGCRSNEITQKSIDSDKVDSLIDVIKINERTLLVKFGYDAITAIKTSEGIVLIDAGISTFLTERYKKIIENHFNLKNFCYVINSHGHHDHIRGNNLFLQAQIIGHEYCHKDASIDWANTDSLLITISKIISDYDRQLQNSMPDAVEWNDSFTQKIRYMGSFLDVKNNVRLKFPDITFSDSLTLGCGDITFEMIYFGKFHSNSDILIYLPEIQTLFTGDLFTKYGRPGMSNSSMTDEIRWIHAINWTNKRINGIRTIVDGHGQILTIDDLRKFNDNLLKRLSDEEDK
jgi:glyoxylase-like metal-dependent hydrolase (beta-lactamase superfamily II)